MKDSPCRGCAKEETCGTPCAKFDVYFRMKWRDIRAMFSVEDALDVSSTRGAKPKRYTVYLNKTEEVIAFGTAKECAAAMGRSVKVFYETVGRCRSGKVKKYTFVVED